MQIPLSERILEAVGGMLITLPIGIIIMAAIVGKHLKRVWWQALLTAVIIAFIDGFFEDLIVGWIVTAIAAFIIRQQQKESFLTRQQPPQNR
jgi:hypothetical protein